MFCVLIATRAAASPGADSASFARYPADGEAPTWHVYRGPTRPSSLTVPMAPYVADSQPASAP